MFVPEPPAGSAGTSAMAMAGPEGAAISGAAEMTGKAIDASLRLGGAIVQAMTHPILSAESSTTRHMKKKTVTTSYRGNLTPMALGAIWVLSGGPERVMAAYKDKYNAGSMGLSASDFGALVVGGPVGLFWKKLAETGWNVGSKGSVPNVGSWFSKMLQW